MKKTIKAFTLLFIFINVVAIFHAYKFTHFSEGNVKTKKPLELSSLEKIGTAIFGISNPRPSNKNIPLQNFKEYYLPNHSNIHVWEIQTENSKGTVVLFHGYSASKASLIQYSNEFIKMGYSALLVDFKGSGGSIGNTTTIGFKEAKAVRDAYQYLKHKGEENIILFGNSMGAVAIMKAINDFELEPKSILLESPFGSMLETVEARFEIMNIPTFPMANLLVFWGGTINGFWAFDHNPIDYAKNINCPTLLFYGAKDTKVSRSEIDFTFENLKGEKKLVVFENAKHENFLKKNAEEWRGSCSQFLDDI